MKVLWRTQWRWNCTADWPQRKSCCSFLHKPSPAPLAPVSWKQGEVGCPPRSWVHLGHAYGKKKKNCIYLMFIKFYVFNRISKSYFTFLILRCSMRQLSFSGLEAQRHSIGPLPAHFLYLSTANGLNGITSSISRIQRSMPSNDQPLVISYTSRIPCRVKVTHIINDTIDVQMALQVLTCAPRE